MVSFPAQRFCFRLIWYNIFGIVQEEAATGSRAAGPDVRVGGQAEPQPAGDAGTPPKAGEGDGALPVESAIFSAYSNGEWLKTQFNTLDFIPALLDIGGGGVRLPAGIS
jgi:hypothetical protein